MLTPDQEKEWAKQVEHVQPYVGHRTAGEWAGAIVAVDLELTTLRAALKIAREELIVASRHILSNTYDAKLMREALAAIDAALGKEESEG